MFTPRLSPQVKPPHKASALEVDHFHFDIEWNYRPVSASTDEARTSSGTPGTSQDTSGPSDIPSGPSDIHSGPGNGASDGQEEGLALGMGTGKNREAGRTRRTQQEASPAGNGSSSDSFPDWMRPRSESVGRFCVSLFLFL